MKKTMYFIGLISGLILSVGITVYALTYYATDVTYKNKTVNDALNELYNKHGDTYGIVRDTTISSTKWTRIGSSIGLVANARIGEGAVQNDFDNIYPWSDIITVDLNYDGRENSRYDGTDEWFTNATGEIMTYIPEFYYKRDQVAGYEYIFISQFAKDGYIKSDAFYIGRYTISTGTHSKSGIAPQISTTLSDFRSSATSLGSGWQLMDYHYFILQLLYLVEYADYNSQAKLGQGYTNTGNTAAIASGGCNSLGMKSGILNNDGKHSVIYRGIEDLYGNIWQFVDGININGSKAYISYTPSKYESDKFNDSYTEVGYTNASSDGYITKLGYNSNHPLVSFPTETSDSASGSTYITDYLSRNTGNRVAIVGGRWFNVDKAGLWSWSFNDESANTGDYCGSRLLKTI